MLVSIYDLLYEVKTVKNSNQYQRITAIFNQGSSKKTVKNIASSWTTDRETTKMIQFTDDLSRSIKTFAFDSSCLKKIKRSNKR